MENPERQQFEVILTNPAIGYFYEILEFLYDHYPQERAEEIANDLRDMAGSLAINPSRGTKESRLVHRSKNYRFILFSRTTRADIKIIYFIEDRKKRVIITDFFPTEMDDARIIERI